MFHYTYFILNAPLGSLFGIAPKTDEKTLARCKLNKLSFHNEGLPISPPTPQYCGGPFRFVRIDCFYSRECLVIHLAFVFCLSFF